MRYRIALRETNGDLIAYVGDSRKSDTMLLSIARGLNIVFNLRDIPLQATVSQE